MNGPLTKSRIGVFYLMPQVHDMMLRRPSASLHCANGGSYCAQAVRELRLTAKSSKMAFSRLSFALLKNAFSCSLPLQDVVQALQDMRDGLLINVQRPLTILLSPIENWSPGPLCPSKKMFRRAPTRYSSQHSKSAMCSSSTTHTYSATGKYYAMRLYVCEL